MFMQGILIKLKGPYTHNDTKTGKEFLGKRRGFIKWGKGKMKEGNVIENEEKLLYKYIKMLKNK